MPDPVPPQRFTTTSLPLLLAGALLVLSTGCASESPGPTGSVGKAARADRALSPVTSEMLGKIDAGLMKIPAGTLPSRYLGSSAKRPKTEVESFWLGKHEVTQEEWAAVMGDLLGEAGGDPKLPVSNVSWRDAQQFVARLNEAKGADLYRLPTASEWEYACRAGEQGPVTAQAKESTLSQVAWWGKNSDGHVHPVATRKPNAFGLYDMLGNVAEWCASRYEDRADSAMRVTAGAYFLDQNLVGQNCYPGAAMGENGKDAFTGFRLARTVPPAKQKASSKP